MVRQAGLDLERMIHGILEGGLDLDDAQAAWDRAIGLIREVTERQRIDQA
jgi:exonuclease VII small subunit